MTRHAPYQRSMVDSCRMALRVGPLLRSVDGRVTLYRFGRRTFGPATIKRMIDAGEAVRRGDFVFATRGA